MYKHERFFRRSTFAVWEADGSRRYVQRNFQKAVSVQSPTIGISHENVTDPAVGRLSVRVGGLHKQKETIVRGSGRGGSVTVGDVGQSHLDDNEEEGEERLRELGNDRGDVQEERDFERVVRRAVAQPGRDAARGSSRGFYSREPAPGTW